MPDSMAPPDARPADRIEDGPWLARFHQGERAVLGEVYAEMHPVVDRAVRAILPGADRETVVAEVFLKMCARAEFRSSFKGGSMRAFFATVGRNQALDFLKKHKKEVLTDEVPERAVAEDWSERAEARKLLGDLRRALPADQLPLFEARFVEGLSERDAAKKLKMFRTTLVYREGKLRNLINRLLRDGITRGEA